MLAWLAAFVITGSLMAHGSGSGSDGLRPPLTRNRHDDLQRIDSEFGAQFTDEINPIGSEGDTEEPTGDEEPLIILLSQTCTEEQGREGLNPGSLECQEDIMDLETHGQNLQAEMIGDRGDDADNEQMNGDDSQSDYDADAYINELADLVLAMETELSNLNNELPALQTCQQVYDYLDRTPRPCDCPSAYSLATMKDLNNSVTCLARLALEHPAKLTERAMWVLAERCPLVLPIIRRVLRPDIVKVDVPLSAKRNVADRVKETLERSGYAVHFEVPTLYLAANHQHIVDLFSFSLLFGLQGMTMRSMRFSAGPGLNPFLDDGPLRTYDIEGYDTSDGYPFMQNILAALREHLPHESVLIEAYGEASRLHSNLKDPKRHQELKRIFRRHQKGLPVFFIGSSRLHSYAIVLTHESVIYANRGVKAVHSGALSYPLIAKMTLDTLKRLYEVPEMDDVGRLLCNRRLFDKPTVISTHVWQTVKDCPLLAAKAGLQILLEHVRGYPPETTHAILREAKKRKWCQLCDLHAGGLSLIDDANMLAAMRRAIIQAFLRQPTSETDFPLPPTVRISSLDLLNNVAVFFASGRRLLDIQRT
jgi:hypothetical protein